MRERGTTPVSLDVSRATHTLPVRSDKGYDRSEETSLNDSH
jgi:hypothetical protein